MGHAVICRVFDTRESLGATESDTVRFLAADRAQGVASSRPARKSLPEQNEV